MLDLLILIGLLTFTWGMFVVVALVDIRNAVVKTPTNNSDEEEGEEEEEEEDEEESTVILGGELIDAAKELNARND